MKTYAFHSAPSSNGRITIVAIINNQEELQFGIARCNPKDNFIKRAGYKIALERANNKPEFVMDIQKEESVAKQFINRCLLLISEPISSNPSRGFTQYFVKERKQKEEGKVIQMNTSKRNYDLDGFPEEEIDELENKLFPFNII